MTVVCPYCEREFARNLAGHRRFCKARQALMQGYDGLEAGEGEEMPDSGEDNDEMWDITSQGSRRGGSPAVQVAVTEAIRQVCDIVLDFKGQYIVQGYEHGRFDHYMMHGADDSIFLVSRISLMMCASHHRRCRPPPSPRGYSLPLALGAAGRPHEHMMISSLMYDLQIQCTRLYHASPHCLRRLSLSLSLSRSKSRPRPHRRSNGLKQIRINTVSSDAIPESLSAT